MADGVQHASPSEPTLAPAHKPKPLARLLQACTQHSAKLCLLLTFVGLLMPLTLPLLDRPVRFDETALLVGGAIPTVRWVAFMQWGEAG